MSGKFITFEGSEGAGKSTQIKLAKKYLEAKGKSVDYLREPGGVIISEKIRRILLDVKNGQMSKECETLLYMAARAQLVAEKIQPALKANKIVISDRFLDSTVVYQGYGCGVDLKEIQMIGRFATNNIQPDLTIIFDIDTRKGLSRIKRKKDRIELRDIKYHNKVRQGYQAIAKSNPKRVKLIPVEGTVEEVHMAVRQYLDKLLEK